MIVSHSVGRNQQRERVQVHGSCQLLDFFECRALETTLQRTQIGAATHGRKVLLSKIFTRPSLLERQAKRDIEFQFAASAKGTMKRYRTL